MAVIYALAHAGLADAYFLQTWWEWDERPAGYEKAKESALRALELDKNLAEAYVILGSILCWNDWKWEESRAILMKAIQLNPNYAIARQYYSELLDILGENAEARKQINLAMDLDPLFFMHISLSFLYYYHEGKYDEALNAQRKLEEINPEFSSRNFNLFNICFKQSDDLKAVEVLQKMMATDTTRIKYVSTVKDIYNETGMSGILNWLIELEQKKAAPSSLHIAGLYSMLKEKENALTWLEKSIEDRLPDIPRININPNFDILRAEPRFLALIEKMGLTPYHTRAPK